MRKYFQKFLEIIINFIFNYLFCFSFAVLLCILSKPAMNEIFLVLVSYVILGTFLAIEIAVSYAMQPRLVLVFKVVLKCCTVVWKCLTAVAWQQREINHTSSLWHANCVHAPKIDDNNATQRLSDKQLEWGNKQGQVVLTNYLSLSFSLSPSLPHLSGSLLTANHSMAAHVALSSSTWRTRCCRCVCVSRSSVACCLVARISTPVCTHNTHCRCRKRRRKSPCNSHHRQHCCGRR